MYPTLSPLLQADREIRDIDMLRDNYLFDVGRNFMAVPANDQRNANVVVVPNNAHSVFGLRQPRVKSPGQQVTVALLSPIVPTTLFVGTSLGIATFWDIPAAGLKGDVNKPFSQVDMKDDVKAGSFHPIVENLVAIGLRSGRVVVYEKDLKAPLIDVAYVRPVIAVAWSTDGQLLFALHTDMTLKIWDARAKNQVAEVKVSQSRSTIGYLAPLPNRRVVVSFAEGGKQELRVFDEAGTRIAARQVGSGGPLGVTSHFTGLIVGVVNRDPKLRIIDPNTLADITTYTHTGPLAAGAPEYVRPDPDGAGVLTVSVATTNNSIIRVAFSVASAPAPFDQPFPTYTPSIATDAWLGGDNSPPPSEVLAPSPKEAAPAAPEEVKVVAAPQTYYRFLQAIAEPPRNYWIDLPVGQAPNPEFNEIVTNGKDFAFIGCGGTPPIIIMPLDKPCRYPSDWKQTIVDPHGPGVGVLAFSPYDPQLLVSGGDDCRVKLWQIPTEWSGPIREPEATFSHTRRVGIAKWSQAARNLVVTATAAPEVSFWDLNTYSKVRSFDSIFGGVPIQDAEPNEFTSVIYTVLRDGTLLAFDPRAASPTITSVIAHKNGGRHRRVLNLADLDYVATFGSSDRGERQVVIWDRKDLSKPLKKLELDSATGAMLPMYEEGAGLIYLGGKGDGHVRFVELCRDDRIIASTGVYETSAPERGLCLLPRRVVDVMGCECSRMLKIMTESMHILHWKVPRQRQEYFQDMIYPPVRDTRSALFEVVDWLGGADEVFPLYDFQPPNTLKASEQVPRFQHKVDKTKFQEEEIRSKPMTIEDVVALAPAISSSDDDDKPESDSW
jgi:WD40 repeat protein